MEVRKCTKCNKEFELTKKFFHYASSTRDTFKTRCKSCVKISKINMSSLDKLLVQRMGALRIRSKKDKDLIDFDSTYLRRLYDLQNGLCAISKVPMTYIEGKGRIPTNVSVDKIFPNKKYTKDNVQLVCTAVNSMKSDLDIEQLLIFCKGIVDNYIKYEEECVYDIEENDIILLQLRGYEVERID